jgi:hypothetical protein
MHHGDAPRPPMTRRAENEPLTDGEPAHDHAWFEEPKTIYSHCDFALINNLRVLPYLHQKSQEEMYQLLRAHTPGKCWL